MLRTTRLILRPLTAELCRASIAGPDVFGAALGARIDPEWPPPLTGDALPVWLPRLESEPEAAVWMAWIWVLAGDCGDDVAVGLGGFYGPPDECGLLGCGYSVVPRFHRRGIATEAMRALLGFAFEDPRVFGVWATMFPDHEPSLGVMRKLGMREVGPGPLEDGRPTIKLVVRREHWRA